MFIYMKACQVENGEGAPTNSPEGEGWLPQKLENRLEW